MNVNCIICSDLISPTAEIYTTSCGHLFHYHCLIQWIERSTTCPQCRSKSTEKTIHRIYFNLANTEGIVDDIGTLQNKLDNLQFQINLRDKDVKIYMDKYKNAKEQNAGLRDEIRDLENKSRISESAIHALKDQISYFKGKAKECDRLGDEVVRLKEKLKEGENVQMVLSGSKEQVNDMLRHNRDPHSLSILVTTLKKELMEADRKYKQVSINLKQTQNNASHYRKEVTEVRLENDKLRIDADILNNCEKERQYLKQRLCELESKQTVTLPCASSSSSQVRRILTESPAPLLRRPFLDSESNEIYLDETISPSISDRVKTIMESDSPYLPIKSSNVGLPSLLNSKYTTLKPVTMPRNDPNKYNILKQCSQKGEEMKAPSGDYSYDGFGGHSKKDCFPSPKPLSGFKRTKSSSSMTSTKFRKLAPNKKLQEYFSNRDE